MLFTECKRDKMKGMTYVLGVSGGIATGKTARCQRIIQRCSEFTSSSSFRLQVAAPRVEAVAGTMVSADSVGHQVYLPGTPTYYALIREFGDGILSKCETDLPPPIDRSTLGRLVFSDKSKMERLNATVWPSILSSIVHTIEQTRTNSMLRPCVDLVVVEAALLVEIGLHKYCDEVWLLQADSSVAVERILQRDKHLDRESATRRIVAQCPADERQRIIESQLGSSFPCSLIDTTRFVSLEEGLQDIDRLFAAMMKRISNRFSLT